MSGLLTLSILTTGRCDCSRCILVSSFNRTIPAVVLCQDMLTITAFSAATARFKRQHLLPCSYSRSPVAAGSCHFSNCATYLPAVGVMTLPVIRLQQIDPDPFNLFLPLDPCVSCHYLLRSSCTLDWLTMWQAYAAVQSVCHITVVRAGAADARPTGVNRPELLPKEHTPVIDVAGFLTPSEVGRSELQNYIYQIYNTHNYIHTIFNIYIL